MVASRESIDVDVIVLEFNELCPRLMDRYIAAGKLPNFQRLRDQSIAAITDAEEEAPKLDPWIQWVTIHSGLRADEHNIFDLGQGRQLDRPGVAQILSDHKIRVGVLGSMNTNYRDLDGFFIPDPWDLEGKAEPNELQPYYQTVASQVQNSSRGGGLSKAELVRFAWFMARHGIRPSTILTGIRQVLSELRDKGVQWRRSIVLERLQLDLFHHLKRKHRTRFSTFFCNSTAHFQHYYWRNAEPEIFDIAPGADDHPSLRAAIEEGYTNMDYLVGQFLARYPKSQLVLLTGLSQQPWTETTKCTFRPSDFNEFLKFVGVSPTEVEVKPVMAEEFHVIAKDPNARVDVSRRIAEATINGQPLMKARLEDNGVFCGCIVNELTARGARIEHPIGGTREFNDLFQLVHTVRSGRHHPHGLFWIQSASPRVIPDPIPLVDVAPTLLSLFGIEAPPYMSGNPISLVSKHREPVGTLAR
jgi:hypothetical protein